MRILATLIGLALLSCGSESDPAPTTPICPPGATQACLGDNRCLGVQACLAGGEAWGTCQCSPTMGGAGGGGSAAQGGAGTSGAGTSGGGTSGTGAGSGVAGVGGVGAGGVNCVGGEPELDCDGVDNNCDGRIDERNDYTKVSTCGTCDHNCRHEFGGNYEVTCTAPEPIDGVTAGVCSGTCASDFWDVDGDSMTGCEYFCENNPDGDITLDLGGAGSCGKDDDCDGEVDEDVDICGDLNNCGRCGKRCVTLNAVAKCVSFALPGEKCSEQNTGCEVDRCSSDYYDLDGSADNGCEYYCLISPPGPEICDLYDNDCDGRVDEDGVCDGTP